MTRDRGTWALLAVVALAVLVRAVHVDAPVVGHMVWRQADTAAIARNFALEDFDIRYPAVDGRGATTGHVECEFPAYAWLVACLYRVFGVHEELARALSGAFSVATVVGVHRLSSLVAGPRVGLWAAYFFAVLPAPVFFGTAIMPEALLVASCVGAVLWFLLWTRTDRGVFLALSWTAFALACLVKPPTLYLGLPLAWLAFRRHGRRALRMPSLWAYAVGTVAALVAWYLHARSLRDETGLTFGIWEYGSDKWGAWRLLLRWDFWDEVVVRRVPRSYLAFFGVPLVLAGFVLRRDSDDERVPALWLVGTLALVVVVAKGVFVHDYYLLPAAVPLCHFLGKACARGLEDGRAAPVKAAVLLAVAGTTVCALVRYHGWLETESPHASDAWQLARIVRRHAPAGDLVISAGAGDPEFLYHAGMRGWTCRAGDLTDEYVEARAAEGAKWLVGPRHEFDDDAATADRLAGILARRALVVDDGTYFVARLR